MARGPCPDPCPDQPCSDRRTNRFRCHSTGKISISADKPEGAINAVNGKIIDIGYLGNISTYHVEIPGGLMVKAQATNTRRLSRRGFTWDDEV